MFSYVFDLTTPADPHRVWEVLTTPELTIGYLWGLAARSAWRPGSPVTFEARGPVPSVIEGDVLADAAPTRLSYTLSAGPDQPISYVTWEIRAEGEGAAVRLSVDEPDELTGPPDPEIEGVWAQVIADLRSVLSRSVSSPSTG